MPKTFLSPEQQWDRTAALFREQNGPWASSRAESRYGKWEPSKHIDGGGWMPTVDWKDPKWRHMDTWDGIGWSHGFVPAIIVRPHRLFRVGDVVIPILLNGGGERQCVIGVSSKGFRVDSFYVQYARYTNGMDMGPWDHEQKIPHWQFRLREDRETKQIDAGHMRYLEVPGHLQDKLVDDPAVRGYVLEAVRALHAARRVSADSPTLHILNGDAK